MIDHILANNESQLEFQAAASELDNMTDLSTSHKLPHGINTRRNTHDNLKKNQPPKQTAKRYFNPQTLMEQPNGQTELFIRRDQEVKVKKFLEKKRKKEEKQHQRKLKRLQKTATTHYHGMGPPTPAQDQEAAALPTSSRRFTKAQRIGGRKIGV